MHYVAYFFLNCLSSAFGGNFCNLYGFDDWNFRLFDKLVHFRFQVENGTRKYDDVYILKVSSKSVYSILVSEILGNATKMNTILGGPR